MCVCVFIKETEVQCIFICIIDLFLPPLLSSWVWNPWPSVLGGISEPCDLHSGPLLQQHSRTHCHTCTHRKESSSTVYPRQWKLGSRVPTHQSVKSNSWGPFIWIIVATHAGLSFLSLCSRTKSPKDTKGSIWKHKISIVFVVSTFSGSWGFGFYRISRALRGGLSVCVSVPECEEVLGIMCPLLCVCVCVCGEKEAEGSVASGPCIDVSCLPPPRPNSVG